VVVAIVFGGLFLYFFNRVTGTLSEFGEHALRMSRAYLEPGAETTGSANLVTGVIFDFRGYDTLGEATILFTAVIGVLTVLRLKGRK
jgi:multisubunit Na+/H+ antiporter MnhB subunit